jgi:CheY-like chemotaxis protein
MPGRILLIEDNAQNRYLATYLLEHHGYVVEAAENGAVGIAAATANKPILILLDIQLPGMSGHDVARSLRANPALRHIPIIAVTSYAMPGDREQAIAAGCNGYIEKPIDPDRFVAEIERFLLPDASEGHGR